MTHYKLLYAPNPIFSQVANPVVTIDDEVRALIKIMLDEMYSHHGVGVGANMVGALWRVVVADLSEGATAPRVLINPEITWTSDETQIYEEASLSFPGIAAKVSRPRAITVKYQNLEGVWQELEAEGDLATVLQHEIDYLDGTVFLDHLSRLKRDSLLKKMKKYKDKHHIDCAHHHHHH